MITEDEVMQLLERADPVRHRGAAPTVDAAGYLDDALSTRSTTLTLIDTGSAPTKPTSRRRWLLVAATAAAAIVAIVIAGWLLAAEGDSETVIPVAPPTVAPSTTAAAPAVSPAEQVARGFLDAYAAFDAHRALSYLTADAIAPEWGSAERFPMVLAMLEAQQYRPLFHPCEVLENTLEGVVLRCPFEVHSFGSDQIGRGPFAGNSWEITVRDGQIVAILSDSQVSESASPLWVEFRTWLEAEHPEDVDVMFDPTGDSGSNLTEESIRLWEERIQDFVNAVG